MKKNPENRLKPVHSKIEVLGLNAVGERYIPVYFVSTCISFYLKSNNMMGTSGADPGFLIIGGVDLELFCWGNKKVKKI